MHRTKIPDLPEGTSLTGRSVLITGANAGLGYAAAMLSLQIGASPVYLAVRTTAKGNTAHDSLLADPIVKEKNPNAVVKVYELEMGKWESVTSFADKFIRDRRAAGEGLDVAMLNAGVYNLSHNLAPTGNEASIQINHLSTALLSLLLLPLLKRSTTPDHISRLMIVSSLMHKDVTSLKNFPAENINYLASLNDKKTFGIADRYGLSKLFIILFLRELCEKVSLDQVIINNIDPGIIKSDLGRGIPGPVKAMIWAPMMAIGAANTVERGAICHVHAVTCVGKESHGLWYRLTHKIPYGPYVYSPDGERLQKRIWTETMQQLEAVASGVAGNI